MPSELGEWSYSWSFSDGSLSGDARFMCVAEGASPGVLQPYRANSHWFAYQGESTVFPKSYHNKAGGSLRQEASWVGDHFYSKLAKRGPCCVHSPPCSIVCTIVLLNKYSDQYIHSKEDEEETMIANPFCD